VTAPVSINDGASTPANPAPGSAPSGFTGHG
jgi:hypothetical protein